MATMQLRPMAMGEILDASFALLRRHAGVFFGVAIVCQGLPTGLSLYVQFNGGAAQLFWLYVASQLLSFIGYLLDRKSTRLNSSHVAISYAVFCLKKKKITDGERSMFRRVRQRLVRTHLVSGSKSLYPSSYAAGIVCMQILELRSLLRDVKDQAE